ncbi:MAG: hypothetical protein JWO74_3148 [Solirubrobacterales bacterium]|nr:hypothetical protein [Solirubrobacterales bacterium]
MKRPPDPSTGDLDGLADFLDLLVREGYGNRGTLKTWATSARKVVAAGEADGLGRFDFRSSDPDAYADAFERTQRDAYSPRSLAMYVSRFRSAVAAYGAFLEDEEWRPARPASGTAQPEAARPAYALDLPSGRIEFHLTGDGLARADLDLLVSFAERLARD